MFKARITQLIAAGLSAAAIVMFSVPIGAQAATLVPANAEGDSYAVGGVLQFIPGSLGSPAFLGPVAPSSATVPPGTTTASESGTVTSGPAGPLNPLVSALNVTDDTSKATLVSVPSTDCQPHQAVQTGFVGPLSGGNACSTIADAELLNSGSTTAPAPQITATGVFAQSVTQQCDPTKGLPFGSADLVDLTLGGTTILGSTVKKPNDQGQIPVNTVIELPGLAKVILNEQKLDNKSGGQGLSVNAIHILLESPLTGLVYADIIIGHAHTFADCTTAPAQQACDVAGKTDPRCNPGVIITKTDNTNSTPPEHANQGQTITYTLSIDTKTLGPCLVTVVTDTLPPGFSFVSASGDLGAPTQRQGQVITWVNGSGFAKDVLVETIVAKISANEGPGPWSNMVETLSNCGDQFGESPPITVNQPGPPAVTVVTSPASGTQAANTLLPFTSTVAADRSGPVWVGLFFLGLALTWMAGMGLVRAKQDS